MTSRPIRSVAADSNVLLSAVAGKAARRVFEHAPALVVVTTANNREEVEEYLSEFAERYNILEIPIWWNDDDYSEFPFGAFTTAQLLKVLGV